MQFPSAYQTLCNINWALPSSTGSQFLIQQHKVPKRFSLSFPSPPFPFLSERSLSPSVWGEIWRISHHSLLTFVVLGRLRHCPTLGITLGLSADLIPELWHSPSHVLTPHLQNDPTIFKRYPRCGDTEGSDGAWATALVIITFSGPSPSPLNSLQQPKHQVLAIPSFQAPPAPTEPPDTTPLTGCFLRGGWNWLPPAQGRWRTKRSIPWQRAEGQVTRCCLPPPS